MTRIVWGNFNHRNSPNTAHIHLLRTAIAVVFCLFLLAAKVGAFEVTSTTITLHWTAPGDDGTSGRATTYDIRYSQSAITAANWGNATRCNGEPTPAIASTPQSFTITGLSPNTTYYIRLKTADEVPNWSALSNELTATTAQTTISPRFSATPDSGAAPLQVSFTDQSTGNISSWQWQFGDGAGSTQRNPVHIYSTPGTFSVTLTVSGPDGSASLVETNLIEAVDTSSVLPPVAQFSATPDSGAAPLQVSFIDLSTGDITFRQWDFGDGTISTTQNPSHIYAAPGDYDIQFVVSGPDGVDTAFGPAYIHVTDSTTAQQADAHFVGNPQAGPAPLTVTFTDQSTGDVLGWQWAFGDGTFSFDQNPSHVYDQPGDFTVQLIVSDANGSDTLIRPQYIGVTDTTQPAGKIVLPSDAVSLEGEADGPIERIRQSDDLYLTLHETKTGGSADEQFSYLHYVVGFDVPQGQIVVLRAEANRPQNSYDENFALQWSVNNIDYVTVSTVTSSYDSLYSATIPITGPARLYIRVTDNDRTPGHNDLDELNIDYMYLEVDGASVAPDTILVEDISVAQAGGVNEDFYAVASVLIHDQFGNPMGGIRVTGTFDGPTNTFVSGTTGVDGWVSLKSDRTGAPEGIWSFRINDVAAAGLAFNPGLSLSLGGEAAVSGVPQSYVLSQNYPNPFNPSTNINLWLPSQGQATVTVYDVTGRQIAVLYEGPLGAGNHVFTWEAGSYASGIYFFRAKVDGKAVTKKATLLK